MLTKLHKKELIIDNIDMIHSLPTIIRKDPTYVRATIWLI